MKLHPIAIACGLYLSHSIVVNAQEEPTEPSEQEAVEVIQVTGSNIRGVDLEGSQPLTVISAQDIERSGALNLTELLRTVNQTRGGTGTFNTAQSGATSTSTPAGQAAAALRGMGPSSTLTLINGRRIAASSFASGTENFVDINSIPLAAIERIEILATGASAIYGADAVAGVINYILKDDFEGFELSAQYGQSEVSADESEIGFQAFYGTALGGGNLSVFADYFDRKAVKATSRNSTATPVLTSNYSYLPKNTPNIYFNSVRSGNEIGNPDCATPFVTTEFGEEICAYYSNEDDYLETPLQSASIGFNYALALGDIDWTTNFIYTDTSSTSFSTPAPINQVDDREGPFVDESVLDTLSPDFITVDDLFIDPFDTPAGRELFGFSFDARFSDPRTIEIDTKAMRLVSELSGNFDNWDWRSGITLSRSDSEQVATQGIYNRFKYHAAIAGELCSNGNIANYDEDTDSLSCSSGSLLGMYNPFFPNTSDNRAILDLAQERPTRDGESTLYGWDATISGELFELNGYLVSAAFGAEIRREEISDIPSLNARARADNDYLVDVFGFGSSLSQADRTQWGAFAEFLVPLSDTLELNLAGRFDDYNDFGSSFNPKVSFAYRPIESVVLRASWSTAFRAPSLTQAGVQLRTTTADFDCGANQTIANLYCEGAGSLRGNNVLELGNPNLLPEESESFSVGFAYSPTKNTDLTIDYWSFDHQDLVDTNMTGVLAAALTDASLRHCGLVPEGERGISYDPFLCDYTDAAGNTIEDDGANLSQILDEWITFENPRFEELPLFRDHVLLLDNTGTQEISGLDFSVFHALVFDQGQLELSLRGTHYISFERNIPGSDAIEELAGTYQYPENVGNAEIFWVQDDWFAGITIFYTSSYEDDVQGLRGREIDELLDLGQLDENEMRDVASWTTVDFSAGYYFDKMDVRLRIENLLDEDAPVAYGSSRGYDSFNHDPFGRRFTVSVNYRF
ncbi:TonB-dependent receptor [Glaciecola sp. XM2]|uniref:TonB-dependent receptor domain-containing protein n=1 Tax=Glaciecola sp. XM2 TaxID=1914931 RepID=UPI001BDE0403|nr:TonB-dependent receptor [Glaciecola sp. XM2]MBT1449333.1 TonB-dependent receptor [Glaciecola sp. XM2]